MFRSVCAAFSLLVFVAPSSRAQEAVGTNGQKHLLRYSLQAGEQLRYEVTHVAKTKTRIRGSEEVSQVHTISQRHWDVAESTDAEMTFSHAVDSVELTQQQGDSEEVRWNSQGEAEPPAIFAAVADQLGRPVSTVTINPRGEEIKRENHAGTKASLGMGSLTLAFPESAIEIGGSWSVPREVRAVSYTHLRAHET